jgi:serine/threonine protein phosphatase PrpC
VSNLVGNADLRVEVGSALSLDVRDTLVVASDGVFDNMSPEEVIAHVRKGSLAAATQQLVDATRRRMEGAVADTPSKPDDMSVVAFRLRPAPRTFRAKPPL